MEEDVKLLTILELVRRGQPVTATASLNSSRSRSVTPLSAKTKSISDYKLGSKAPDAPPTANSNPNHKILAPLGYPAILIGTLTLPTENLKCPNRSCFQFSDDSSTICCDILDFNVRVIGNKIQVSAWNFIPLKHSGGGFLEIIKWSFTDSNSVSLSTCLSIDSIPMVSGTSSPVPPNGDKSKDRYGIHGPIESVSPILLIPCSIGASKSNNLRGFIVQTMVCECKLCNPKKSITDLHCLAQGQHPHSFMKPLFIYFCGSSSNWHPAITKLVGNVVTLSGLKKKLVFIGKEESQLMFVTTENSVLHLLRSSKKWSSYMRNVVGKGECGAYTGVVKGVYMQGMVVELHKEVWLLLTDQLLSPPHSLRVGAIISLRNVHFVNPKFVWTEMLILGACFKTSIIIESFSPLETGCHIVSQSQSLLGKFIESLAFSARLWALLIISCFRKKFAGILSEKEILGSKHKEGLAQMFSRSLIPPSVIRARHGMLTELCKHDSLGCGSEPYCVNLKLVVTISSFLRRCEAMWRRVLLQNNCHISHGSTQCEGRSHSQPLRRMFQGEALGVSLLGSLKISPSSGRLQLVDATGSIDVIIPDLPSTWKSSGMFEVVNYSLIIEGTPDLEDHPGLLDYESFSCRHIFRNTPWAREMHLTIYIYFHLSNATSKNLPFYPCAVWNNGFKELQGGRLHLIWVTHKYPALEKFQGEPVISDISSTFAEAIILPWDLFLTGKDGTTLPVEVSGDQLNEPLAFYPCEILQDHLPTKKHKVDKTSGQDFKGSAESKCGNLCSSEIPCSVNVKTAEGYHSVGSGKLCFTNCKITADFKQSAKKVLLEFNSENFFKYQIGSFYIIEHHPEESFCSIKDYSDVNGVKVFITSRTHLWSLSFSSDEAVTNNGLSNNPSKDDSSFSSREVLISNQVEQCLSLTCNFPKSYSDVCLYLSANAMRFLEVELSEIKVNMSPEGTSNVSPDILTSVPSSGFSSGSLEFTSLFPEGNLTSIRGCVVGIHSLDGNSANVHLAGERSGGVPHMRFFQESTGSTCIQVLVNNQMVNIFSSLSKYAYPVGFGPGADATFHRVLKLRGTNKLKLILVSFIVLNSIRVANEPCGDEPFKIQSKSYASPSISLENASSGMISELIQCSGCKPMQFNCRVIAVHVLVLDKSRKYHDLHPEVQSKAQFVDIPLVGFVLDDGSFTCCCWANAERAATLLRLHEELPPRAFESSGCTLKWVGINKSCWKSTMFHLDRILRKHGRITVRNYGSIIESSYQDLKVSVSSENSLSSSDENLLKFIVLNACFGTFWTVVATMMDSNAVQQLEKEHLTQMDVKVLPMQNVWAAEVQYLNTLTEARNIIKELLDS
ncbi:CST complex subunit CTC1 isoform X2 [Jatropha curcas]|uniref:CST complex subunit CTC1 isoform X2 n=1 Tax=Jatropha curcas TaxID=180498 RepID=UPI001893A3C8|nr:CST complex subunit CTC1 isoform X2 [Jatropha curcas]